MVLAITRLRLARLRGLAPFWQLSRAGAERATANPACLGGATYMGPGLTFWTATLWRNEREVAPYFLQDASGTVLPFVAQWCSEACSAHLDTESRSLPVRSEIPGLLSRRARFYPLAQASILQQSAVVSPRAPWFRQVFKEKGV
jgi:hypothetical protein